VKLEDVQCVSVLGSGTMGHGIAQNFAMAGYEVFLYDIDKTILERALANVRTSLGRFADAGLIRNQDIEGILSKIKITTDLKEAVERADFITEATPEKIELKQDIFKKLEELCPKHAIIATNTSSLTLTEIGAKTETKERLVITHYFNPPNIVPTVEVVKGEKTSDETIKLTVDLLEKVKKVPVVVNIELPGFVVNRIQMALIREVLDLFDKGIASAEDIDKAVKGSVGFRLASIGPILTVDFGGIDVWSAVATNLFPEICSSPEPPAALIDLAAKDHKGVKSGKGFYDYGGGAKGLDVKVVTQKRDKEFISRLKNLYWNDIS